MKKIWLICICSNQIWSYLIIKYKLESIYYIAHVLTMNIQGISANFATENCLLLSICEWTWDIKFFYNSLADTQWSYLKSFEHIRAILFSSQTFLRCLKVFKAVFWGISDSFKNHDRTAEIWNSISIFVWA